jgi:hypothetical protein
MAGFTLFWKEEIPLAAVLAFLAEKLPEFPHGEMSKTDVTVSKFEVDCDCGVERRAVSCSVRYATLDGDLFAGVRQDVYCKSRNLSYGKQVAQFWLSQDERTPREMTGDASGSVFIGDEVWHFWWR